MKCISHETGLTQEAGATSDGDTAMPRCTPKKFKGMAKASSKSTAQGLKKGAGRAGEGKAQAGVKQEQVDELESDFI